MLHYILLIASDVQISATKASLLQMGAEPFRDRTATDAFTIKHRSIEPLELRIHLLNSLDAITPHLRQNPVDLLIYDEREGGLDAVEAAKQIYADVEDLANLWGPDFHFPLSRMIAILGESESAVHKTFLLGRENVRDVLVAPKGLFKIIRWVARLLTDEVKQNSYRVGCALSGGGLEGFLFQLGSLHALNLALSGRSMNDIDVYSGISSGSILAASLASKVPLSEIVDSMYRRSKTMPHFKASMLYDLAIKDMGKRFLSQMLSWDGLDPTKWSQNFARSIPTGFFKGDSLKNYIKQTIESYGGKDRFGSTERELFIGGTDQDTFEHVVFGLPPWDQVSISDAVRASCSLPPFFTPARLEQRLFIDGQITKTCNLELTVRRGCNLIFIIDPMQPFAYHMPGTVEKLGGFFTLIQAIKTLVQTRFRTTLSHATVRYPDVDFLVFQPYDECAALMSGLPMKYRVNTQIIEMAFRSTLKKLRERHHVYSVKLEKYGFHLASQRQLLELERGPI